MAPTYMIQIKCIMQLLETSINVRNIYLTYNVKIHFVANYSEFNQHKTSPGRLATEDLSLTRPGDSVSGATNRWLVHVLARIASSIICIVAM